MSAEPSAVWLRPARNDDLADLARWLSEPATNRWLFSQFRGKIMDERSLRPMTMGGKNRLYVAGVGDSPSAVVGISNIDRTDASGMMWWALGDAAMAGQGITTRAVVEGLQVAFGDLGLHSVNALVMAPNVPSLRICEKAGFRRAGTLRESFRLDGEFVDGYLFDAISGERRG